MCDCRRSYSAAHRRHLRARGARHPVPVQADLSQVHAATARAVPIAHEHVHQGVLGLPQELLHWGSFQRNSHLRLLPADRLLLGLLPRHLHQPELHPRMRGCSRLHSELLQRLLYDRLQCLHGGIHPRLSVVQDSCRLPHPLRAFASTRVHGEISLDFEPSGSPATRCNSSSAQKSCWQSLTSLDDDGSACLVQGSWHSDCDSVVSFRRSALNRRRPAAATAGSSGLGAACPSPGGGRVCALTGTSNCSAASASGSLQDWQTHGACLSVSSPSCIRHGDGQSQISHCQCRG